VHISDMTHDRVPPTEKSVQKFVKEGQPVRVVILKIDWENNRISLGMKQLQDDPFVTAMNEVVEGAVVTGRVVQTAEFGAFVAEERLLADGHLQATLDELLAAVRDGSFADRMTADHAAGFPWLKERRAEVAADPIEDAGRAVRDWMPWLRGADGG